METRTPKFSSSMERRFGINILSINIRCLLANLVELNRQLELHQPHVVLIQETWLNSSVEHVDVSGYVQVSRRDRKETDNRGGILTLQRRDFNALVHIANCPDEERSWHFMQLGVETILVGNWYRPGATIHDKFAKLHDKISQYYKDISGVFIAGDLNIHHKKWLRFSSEDTAIGSDLKAVVDHFGMVQLVREPTRQAISGKEYLLDLALTDINGCSAKVLPRIADHKGILAKLPLPEVLESEVEREVWILARADWKALIKELLAFDWSALAKGSAEDSFNYFLDVLWLHLVKHIPRQRIKSKKSSHPWLNERCRKAIARKNAAEGTINFSEEQQRCTKTLNEERALYTQRVKEKLAALPRSSKAWWRLNRELLRRRAQVSSIPALREGTAWLHDAKHKANAFARVFDSKSQLPEESVDTPFFGSPLTEFQDFVTFRSRSAYRLFKKLDPKKATGRDKVSAAILKRLHACLAVPFTKVVRRLFFEGCWPSAWKFHLLVPIFKKGAAFQPTNYRGVHLTTILSKVAERLIGEHLVPLLRRTAFGDSQWAFTCGLSSRDLVTMLMMKWILAVCTQQKIGCFLGDISGAFDKVFKPFLMAKLYRCGVGEDFLRFLDAYLAPRTGQVCVQGEFSDTIPIDNTVFQGTVLGPPLWNTFFADVSEPASSTGGEEEMFADDLSVFQQFPTGTPAEEIMNVLGHCRDNVHKWGRKNRVDFDATKEHLVILHPSEHQGTSFKMLGCMIDPDLRMHSCIDQILSKIRPKITAILRTRGFYSTSDLVQQFKTHVWCHMEIHNGALFHAAPSLLEKLDQVQNSFLRVLGISPAEAFLDLHFAPPQLRRNIGILGLLHKRVLGKCHPSYEQLLPWYVQRFPGGRGHGHNKQLYGHWVEASAHPALFARSIFAVTDVYNNLPQHVVDAPSVGCFQNYLTRLSKSAGPL